MDFTFIFNIAILIMSVVIHEFSHGYAALFMGDVTAKYAGRLTMNPLKHLDPIGSVFLPLILSLLPGNFIFGWAKPVPYNPYNLRNRRWGELVVAIAGPLSNIFLALIFSLLIRFAPILDLPNSIVSISLYVVIINLVLAVFNLTPIPPLDGSKILLAIFAKQESAIRNFLERYGLVLVVFFILFVWQWVFPVVIYLAQVFTGVNLR